MKIKATTETRREEGDHGEEGVEMEKMCGRALKQTNTPVSFFSVLSIGSFLRVSVVAFHPCISSFAYTGRVNI
jgi:hypothetical protein